MDTLCELEEFVTAEKKPEVVAGLAFYILWIDRERGYTLEIAGRNVIGKATIAGLRRAIEQKY